jgi:hypothetical protein
MFGTTAEWAFSQRALKGRSLSASYFQLVFFLGIVFLAGGFFVVFLGVGFFGFFVAVCEA